MWLQLYKYKIYSKLIIDELGYNGFYNKITNKFILIQVNPLTPVPAVTGHAKTHPQFPVPAVKNHVRTIPFPTLPEEIVVLLLFYCC